MGKRTEVSDPEVAFEGDPKPSASLRMMALRFYAKNPVGPWKFASKIRGGDLLGLPADHPEVWKARMNECGLLAEYEVEMAKRGQS